MFQGFRTSGFSQMALAPEPRFTPNVFTDISDYLEPKIALMTLYASEMDAFPFPRSRGAMEAQGRLHGARIGTAAAEAFMLLYEHN